MSRPFAVSGNSEHGKAFRLVIKRMVRLLIANRLHKSEQVGPTSLLPEFCDETFRVGQALLG